MTIPAISEDFCHMCGGEITPSPQFPEYPFGHYPQTIYYVCHACNHEWSDDWCSSVDADCPVCFARDVTPDHSEPHTEDPR